MPRNEQRRQKSLQKHAARRKAKRHALAVGGQPGGLRGELRAAAHWPLEECLITRDWQKPGEIVQLAVARRAPDGGIGAAVFLIDLGCLGVKSATVARFDSLGQYQAELRADLAAMQPMKAIGLDLAAKIVREAVAYARGLGFSPDKDYYDAALLLGGAEPERAAERVPLGGEDGKPLYIVGAYDNPTAVITRLNRAVGEGNYTIVSPLASLPGYDLGDGDDDGEADAIEAEFERRDSDDA
ncbi:MAG TPA: hypothetical protein VKV26_03025 [Dehalococcoidia bacterium]|nr:hypothetical protein [Dehalococcoidia bacterium]